DHVVWIWLVETGERVLQFGTGGNRDVFALAYSPDGKWILSGQQESDAVLWNAETGGEQRRLKGHAGWIVSVAFSPDGLSAATGSQDETIIVWDVQSGRRLVRFSGPRGRFHSVAWSPGGRRLVS